MVDLEHTVLVVEDDREVREIALALIEAAGFQVLAAESADEAYRLLQASPDLRVDVLFTDIVMPGRLDGVDLANLAQALRPGLHVLFATGFANFARANRDRDISGPVLQKPYRAAELRRALADLLDHVD